MRWQERNSALERCKGKGGGVSGGGSGGRRDKVVCIQSQQTEVTICLVVFVCLFGGGSQNIRHTEVVT